MSITKQVTVWCDGCQQWDQSTMTAAAARKDLKKRGWSQRGTNDYCPHCTEKMKHGEDPKESEGDHQ